MIALHYFGGVERMTLICTLHITNQISTRVSWFPLRNPQHQTRTSVGHKEDFAPGTGNAKNIPLTRSITFRSNYFQVFTLPTYGTYLNT